MLIITYFSEDAFDFALDMTAVLTLIPFLLAALYALKLCITRETYQDAMSRGWRGDLIIAVLATIYTIFLIYAAGLSLALISLIFYAPVTVMFVMLRREKGQQIFSPRELILFLITLAGAIAGVVALSQGWIQL